jgi:Ca2+:H+ antiporter
MHVNPDGSLTMFFLQLGLYFNYHRTGYDLTSTSVLVLLLPAAFFSALGGGSVTSATNTAATSGTSSHVARSEIPAVDPTHLVSDTTKGTFLAMSRGLAVILLLIYICSRIFRHSPPSEDKTAHHPLAPQELKEKEEKLKVEDPEVNVWMTILMLLIALALAIVTTGFLVNSIEFVGAEKKVQEE